MIELNNEQYIVANSTKTTFELMSIYTGAHTRITNVLADYEFLVQSVPPGLADGDIVKIVNTSVVVLDDQYFEVYGLTTIQVDGEDRYQFGLKNLNGGQIGPIGAPTGFGFDGRTEIATPIDSTNFGAYIEGGDVRRAIKELRGLEHLEDKAVSILADGNVEPQQIVSNGRITLPSGPAGRIHVGLPYVSQMESLELTDSEGRLTGRLK
jgi:hypothetical protein